MFIQRIVVFLYFLVYKIHLNYTQETDKLRRGNFLFYFVCFVCCYCNNIRLELMLFIIVIILFSLKSRRKGLENNYLYFMGTITVLEK